MVRLCARMTGGGRGQEDFVVSGAHSQDGGPPSPVAAASQPERLLEGMGRQEMTSGPHRCLTPQDLPASLWDELNACPGGGDVLAQGGTEGTVSPQGPQAPAASGRSLLIAEPLRSPHQEAPRRRVGAGGCW